MSVINVNTTVKNTMLNAMRAAVDAGGAAGVAKFYTGPMPATALTPITTQVLLGTATLAYPSGVVTGGAYTFDTITDDAGADNSGVAAFVRIESSAGTPVIDIDTSNIGGTGGVQMNTINVVSGGPLRISSAVITL